MINGRPVPAPQRNSEHSVDDSWTIGRLLGWTAEYLKRHGSPSARLDAEVMLAHVLDWQRVELYTHFDDEVGERPRNRFRDLVSRRAKGAPVAYLVGHKEFFSLAFIVSPAVLIPRPESEFVVTEYLALTRHLDSPVCIDVGTGSGCLAIAAAHQQKGARFVAIDRCERALEVARQNATRHGVADRIDFRLGDQLEPVGGEGPFDAIVSNPPYIPTNVIDSLEPGVRDFEPRIALDGGVDGLAMVARLIENSVGLLKAGGHLVLEIGSDQEAPVRALIERQAQLRLAPTIYDHAKHPRVITATRRES
jgi:release factor glutamine methyltransferase